MKMLDQYKNEEKNEIKYLEKSIRKSDSYLNSVFFGISKPMSPREETPDLSFMYVDKISFIFNV